MSHLISVQNTLTTQEIPMAFGASHQEPGTESKCVLLLFIIVIIAQSCSTFEGGPGKGISRGKPGRYPPECRVTEHRCTPMH